ncbi:MAG: phosphatidate cytidylyltransferase [Hyphomonadaceae bacterium]
MKTAAADAPAAAGGAWADLLPRTLSAAALIPLGLGAAWAGGPWIAGAAGACALAMSYEWARMSEPKELTPAFLFALVGALGAVMFASWGAIGVGLAWLAGCGVVSAIRRRTLAHVVETAAGAFYIGAPPAVFVWLRGQEPGGFELAILLFVAIWAADVAAYFAGRLIGGPKLLPNLSPQKTWAGLIFGIAAGAAASLLAAQVFAQSSAALWLAAGATLALVGLAGDLFESFLKRRFGVKDSSRLIPGHGGVLDRLDGLMAATLFVGAAAGLAPGAISALVGG